MRSDPAIWLANQFYTKLVGKVLPAKWFGVEIPDAATLSIPVGKPTIEIVAHCWQYAHLLVYQLSSLVNHPPKNTEIVYSLYFSEEDQRTFKLIKKFDALSVPGVTWRWHAMSKEVLFRRAIGRHQAAKATNADWIWFSDCDLIFHKGCLDSLAKAVHGLRSGLVYPASEFVTPMLPSDHPLVNNSLDDELLVEIDPAIFQPNAITKAKGAFQIVHADVARAAGYCGALSLYQQPDSRWRKTYEDTVFRNLLGYEGQAVTVDSLYRIRHSSKGRYASTSQLSKLRSRIRHATDTAAQ